jgi:hypothetical protein
MAAIVATGVPSTHGQSPRSLYERLGGCDAVSVVVEDFAGRLFVDPKVGKLFVGMSTDSRAGFKRKDGKAVGQLRGAARRPQPAQNIADSCA